MQYNGTFCSGGGGHGYGGGASGGYVLAKRGCSGAGGAGGGFFANATHSVYLSKSAAFGTSYGSATNQGIVSLRVVLPLAAWK